MKGKEHFKEDIQVPIQSNVLPCYLATILVEFYGEGEVPIHSERVPLTSSGSIEPNSYMISLIRLKLPKKPGTYRVEVGKVEPAKKGSFGATPLIVDDLSKWVENKSSVILPHVTIKE